MNPTQRFSNRVEDYRKFRPGYPPQIIADLTAAGLLTPHSIIADIGSGTGLLARLFLDNGNSVLGIEPNPDMRAAGEQDLRHFPRFTSINATAEATSLPDLSVDLITAGQAFHWFDRPRCKKEFHRILRLGGGVGRWGGGGTVALIWNDRLTTATPFLVAYEKLLQDFATDYTAIDHKNITDDILTAFFAPSPMTKRTYPTSQTFDLPALTGRLLSSSYAPPPGHPNHTPMLTRLTQIFDAHQKNNQITFHYQTLVYTATL